MSTRRGLTAREVLSVLADILNMGMKAAALMQMMFSYQQQMNLAFLVKTRM